MITMYVMLMLYALDANACLTPRGVTPPRGANVEGEAIGACRGGVAALGGASPRLPSIWRLHVGPGLHSCGFGAHM
jgi:hypothetical protein